MCEEVAYRNPLTLDGTEYVKVGPEVTDLSNVTCVICETAIRVYTFLNG